MATQEMFLSLDNRLRGREAQVGEQEDPTGSSVGRLEEARGVSQKQLTKEADYG